MSERELIKINWTAVLVGFGVDWSFSLLVGFAIMTAMFALKGGTPDTGDALPTDVDLAVRIAGVLGAAVGGVVAGYLARMRGSLHGVLGSIIGLLMSLCAFGLALDLRELGFIVLNLVAAGYGGGAGERWRARREDSSD
jgi:hypothetical protein